MAVTVADTVVAATERSRAAEPVATEAIPEEAIAALESADTTGIYLPAGGASADASITGVLADNAHARQRWHANARSGNSGGCATTR